MNFLRGMMDVVPVDQVNVVAIRKILDDKDIKYMQYEYIENIKSSSLRSYYIMEKNRLCTLRYDILTHKFRFNLSEKININHKVTNHRGEVETTRFKLDLIFGTMELSWHLGEDYAFHQAVEIYGIWKNCLVPNELVQRSRRVSKWRQLIRPSVRLSDFGRWVVEAHERRQDNLWREEVQNFRQSFLNNDSRIHDQIRAAILQAMQKPVCERCLNEKRNDHVCA